MKEWLKSKENIKTKRNIIISIILVFSLWYYENYILVDNVFDYMYYSRSGQRLFINENEIETMEYTYHQPENFVQSAFSFFRNNISNGQNILNEYYLFPSEEYSQFSRVTINHKYLDIYNEPTNFEYSIEAATINFNYFIYFETIESSSTYYNIGFEYIYKPDTNVLYPQFGVEIDKEKDIYIYNESTYIEAEDLLLSIGITAKELEEIHQWFLYDRVLNDFFAYNKYKTRFSMDDLGDFEIAELNTYYEDGFISTF